MFCARPYTGPLKIKTIRQGPYSKGAHSLVRETHKPQQGASKNHRNWDSEPYGIYVGTVVKGWEKKRLHSRGKFMIGGLINFYQVAFGERHTRKSEQCKQKYRDVTVTLLGIIWE